MALNLKDVLDTAGPTASLVFASWIFLTLVSQRLAAAMDRYRLLIGERRTGEPTPARLAQVDDQVRIYRRRCTLLGRAMVWGIVATVLLLLTLMLAMGAMCHPALAVLGYVSLGTATIGLGLLIAVSVLLGMECRSVDAILRSEAEDLPPTREAADRGRRP